MALQVRVGIEGLLGIPVLRELAEDLRAYARARRSQSPAGSTDTISQLEQQRDGLKKQVDAAAERISKIEPQLAILTDEREHLTRELAGFGAGTQAQLQELLTRLNQHRKDAEVARDRLQQMLAADLSLALAGRRLRDRALQVLRGEAARESWESGRRQGDKNLDRFLSTLTHSLEEIRPPLLQQQVSGVSERARVAWDALWHPPPDDCADRFTIRFCAD